MKTIKNILGAVAGTIAFLLALVGGPYAIYLLVGLMATGVAHIVLSAVISGVFLYALICLTIDILGDVTGSFDAYEDEIF